MRKSRLTKSQAEHSPDGGTIKSEQPRMKTGGYTVNSRSTCRITQRFAPVDERAYGVPMLRPIIALKRLGSAGETAVFGLIEHSSPFYVITYQLVFPVTLERGSSTKPFDQTPMSPHKIFGKSDPSTEPPH